MQTIQIKEAYPADFPAVIEIIDATWEPTYREILAPDQIRFMQQEIYNLASLQNQYQAGQRFFILYETAMPVGFAAFSPTSEPQTFKLNKIYVKPGAHGKGYGQILINYIEQEVKKQHGNCLILNVNRFNKARYFYERHGYTILKEEDIAIGPYWMNDYVLQKSLL